MRRYFVTAIAAALIAGIGSAHATDCDLGEKKVHTVDWSRNSDGKPGARYNNDKVRVRATECKAGATAEAYVFPGFADGGYRDTGAIAADIAIIRAYEILERRAGPEALKKMREFLVKSDAEAGGGKTN